jgi:hypothetical protein
MVHAGFVHRPIGKNDFAVIDDGNGRIRDAAERANHVWLWHVTIPIPGPDRTSAATGRCQQNDPGSLQIALQRHGRSATRFQHPAIFPRKAHFSCFGNHPDRESRLTFQR